MSIKRIIAVMAIFVLACLGWWTLGTATHVRSSGMFDKLGRHVQQLYGTPLVQQAPTFAVQVPGSERTRQLIPDATELNVAIRADHRRKGLIWYPTYICSFDGAYTVRNPEQVAQTARLHIAFPSATADYDDFILTLDGEDLDVPFELKSGVNELVELGPGQSRTLRVRYRTRGMREWSYLAAGEAGRVRNLKASVTTDFDDVDYVAGSLSPMNATKAKDGGMDLVWEASDLLSSSPIGIIVPEKLNPGPLTTRITFFAPVCLLFFFVMVAAINIIYKVDIHPMHYLFVAAGFFAFHLLLAYLVDVVNVHVAFVISGICTLTLVTGYLSAALKGKLPLRLVIGGQLFYLILFSYSFFIKGMTGLTIAIGSVATLAVLMKVTAGIDWNTVFVAKPSQPAPRTSAPRYVPKAVTPPPPPPMPPSPSTAGTPSA